jgi:hypothetical protein
MTNPKPPAPDYPALLEAIRELVALPRADAYAEREVRLEELEDRTSFMRGVLDTTTGDADSVSAAVSTLRKRAGQPLPYTPRPAEAGIEVSGKPGTARQAIAEVHAMLGEDGAR